MAQNLDLKLKPSTLLSTSAISGTGWVGDTYTSGWETELLPFFGTVLQTDEDGTLFFDFSLDGGTSFSTYPVGGVSVSSGINEVHTAYKGSRSLRIRFVGTGGRTYFRLLTDYSPVALPLTAPLSQSINSDQDASVVRSVATGETEDGNYQRVGVRRADKGQFAQLTKDVELTRNRTIFGALVTETPVPDILVNFSSDVLNLVFDTTVDTGTATVANGQSVLSTGIGATGSAERRTRINTNYRPGSEMRFDFTAVFDTPVANSEQYIGCLSQDEQDGFYLGYTGTSFCVHQRVGGADNQILSSSFNGDPLDGSAVSAYTRDGVPEAWNPQKGNVYRIRFGWLGYSIIVWEIQSPDGEYIPIHTLRYPNTEVVPSLEQADLGIWSRVTNTGNTTNLSLKTASWRGATLGAPRPQARTIFRKTDGEDGTLPSGTLPIIDPVLNTDANTFDSGWIRTSDYPGGNFINIVGNQSLEVYLLNASNTDGDNIVGDTAPTIQTVAFVPGTLQAPYFDDYYRVLIVNTSGSSLTSYTINNRGFESQQQSLVLGIEQTLLNFFTASLNRSILAAADGVGQYDNIGRGGVGDGLDTHVIESEPRALRKPMQRRLVSTHDLTTTSTQLDATQLDTRSAVLLTVDPDNNQAVHINLGASATTASLKLDAGYGIPMTIGNDITIHGRSAAGTQRVYLWQFGEPL